MIIEKLTADALFVAGFSGAGVVIFGGLYALFLALSFIKTGFRDRFLAYVNYLALCFAFYHLANALYLDFIWQLIILLLLVAYLISPHLIWKLTHATHVQIQAEENLLSSDEIRALTVNYGSAISGKT